MFYHQWILPFVQKFGKLTLVTDKHAHLDDPRFWI